MARANASADQSVVGIDLGGTNMMIGIVDPSGQVVARKKVDTDATKGADDVIQRMAMAVSAVISDAGLGKSDIAGIGLGAPGVVNVKQGKVVKAVNLCWNDLPVATQLAEAIGIPVTLDNDVNVGTWGEYRAGAAQDADDALGIFVGTGIGGGLVINGKLYHGHFMSAGEIGHTVVNRSAGFGNRTLEQLTSRGSVVAVIEKLIASNHSTMISEISKGKRIRSKVIGKAMRANDELTLRVLKEAAETLGVAIANVVTLLSLDCVVVGGGLTEAADERWLEWIRTSFHDAVFPEICRDCRIVESTLGDDAGLLGAALLIRDRLTTGECVFG